MNIVTMDISNPESIVVSKGKIMVNGVDVTPDAKHINIVVTGGCGSIKVDCCESLSVDGDTGPVSTQSGDVEVKGNVDGSVSTMSGDVECGDIAGSVSTMSGDINRK